MVQVGSTFSGFSVDDLDAAKKFYTEIIGAEAHDDDGGTSLTMPGGKEVWMYAKPNHQPATYTMLNLIVDDVEKAVDELTAQGVTFERYDGMHQDDKGIARGKQANMGPDIAWLKDPAGNILSVLEM
jgi:catechol 2,3-dioxygenase-like lactoylglutathione lyase family enzyme